MRSVEMAVVVSEEAGEEEKFAKQKLDIKPHRDRMNKVDEHGHDIEYNFKDPERSAATGVRLRHVADRLRCADAFHAVSRQADEGPHADADHRPREPRDVVEDQRREKKNGEIMDYYNVFRNMKKALKDYAQGQEGQNEMPVREKAELFKLLDDAIEQGMAFCPEMGVDLREVLDRQGCVQERRHVQRFRRIPCWRKDEWRKGFTVYENTITWLYEACKPEILGRARRPLGGGFPVSARGDGQPSSSRRTSMR